MNNEEKILSILETLVTKVDKLEDGQAKLEEGQVKLEEGQAKLEKGQVKLEEGQAKLEEGQARLEERQTKIEAAQTRLEIKTDAIADELQDTKHILVRFENDYKLDRGGLFDGMELIKDRTARIEAKINKIETRVDNHELHIRALERPLW